MKINKNKKGISLIVLIITIIIMIVLAGTIILTLVNSGIIGQTRMGVFKNNVANYKAELQMFIADASLKNQITVYGETVPFEVDEFSRDENLIQEYIKSMSDIDAARFLIIQGNLVYIADDTLFTAEEMTALDDIGVKPSEYTYAENIGEFEAGVDYTGEIIYVNPRPGSREGTIDYLLSYTDNENFSVIGGDSGGMLYYRNNNEYYMYMPAGTVMDFENGLYLILNGQNIQELVEVTELKYGAWYKTYPDINEPTEMHLVLPENLPKIECKGEVGPVGFGRGTISDMGNYASFEPYVPVI